MNEANGSIGSRGRRLASRSLILTAFVALAGCQRSDPAPEASATPEQTETNPATTPAPLQALAPMGRAEILAAVAAAADEVAAGNPLPKANLELANRSFELRLPIACGNGATGALGGWRVDPATNVLRVSFNRQNWADEPLFKELAPLQTFETAEGFWIERPWTRSEQCPPAVANAVTPDDQDGSKENAAAAANVAPEQLLALVQYFSSDASRVLRRGKRPYTYTAKLPKDAEETSRAFRVKIVGRITGYADGQPVHCTVRHPAKPPVCAVAVEFGKVVLENAETGENLAEWGN